jgi:hypothetical protein
MINPKLAAAVIALWKLQIIDMIGEKSVPNAERKSIIE